MDTKTTVLVDTVRFGESPRWHEGKLWFSDLFTQRVMNIDLQGHVQTVVEMQDVPSALGWTLDGQMLIVSAMQRRLLRRENQDLVEAADLSTLVSHPCNDIVIDAQGRAYIGNMGFDFGNPEAAPELAPVLLVMPDGQTRIVAEGLAFPNGMVITPDGRTLIVAESYAARLTGFTIAPDGSLSQRRTWAQFEQHKDFGEGQITPDGICLDAEGAIWIASPNTKEVLRVREGGQITTRIPIGSIAIACMLGGEERSTLFVTTSDSQNPEDTQAKGRIEVLQVDIPGAGLPW